MLLAYGLWTGQRAAGFRAMWTVLGTVAAVGLVGALILPSMLRLGLTGSGPLTLSLFSLLSLVLSFLPLLVAALQLGQLHHEDRRTP